MKRCASVLWMAAALLATSSCAKQGNLNIRASPTGLVSGERAVPVRIAEARAHFALGNVALALEGFRKALRDAPESVDALNGMAVCYDRMSRFDLSRRYYEQAMAVAPSDARLYSNLALSLEVQGRAVEAEVIRRELQERFVIRKPVFGDADKAAALNVPRTRANVISVAELLAETLTDSVVAPRAQSRAVQGARLERASMGEVVLVTTGRPIWRAHNAEPTARRLVAARAPARRAGDRLMLLNGARVSGLAARTRSDLQGQGWHGITIGDAPAVRASSVILYPAGGHADALQLSKHLGFAIRQRASSGRRFFIVLGRDAVGHPRHS